MSRAKDRPPLSSALHLESVALSRHWEVSLGMIDVRVGIQATTMVPSASPTMALDVWEWEGGRTVC